MHAGPSADLVIPSAMLRCYLMQILLDERPYGDRSEAKVILSLERGIDPYDWDFRLAPQWTLSKCCRRDPVDRPVMSEIARELHITGSIHSSPGPRSSARSYLICHLAVPFFFFTII